MGLFFLSVCVALFYLCMCYFVLLNQYWGIVRIPESSRVNRPQIITWGLPDPHPLP